MEFITLYKKFVSSSQEEFDLFYQNRFYSESTIHFPFTIKDNEAFFFFHPEIVGLLSKIYLLDKEVDSTFDDLPQIAQQQYVKKSFIDEIQFTNEIEGVVSTRKEINDIMDSIIEKIPIESRFEGIVNKYVMLMKDGDFALNSSVDIRKIYDEMLLKEISKEDPKNIPDGIIFRKESVGVYDTTGEKIHNGLTPETKIIEYMDYSLKILNDESLDPLIRVSIFHYLFGFIHPFYDGNGRINRFISSYVLSKHLTRVMGFRLSMTIKENLSSYYSAFKQTNDVRNKGDLTTFVYLFLNILYDSLKKTKEYAGSKKEDLNYYHKLCSAAEFTNKNSPDLLWILIQAEVFSKMGLSITELADITGHSVKTCYKAIEELNNHNLLKIIKSGKRCFYTCDLKQLVIL